jgi:hypothetical protein
MKAIGYAVAVLGLAVSAQASVLGLAPAALPQQYYQVQITASPTVAITNAYFIYGRFWQDGSSYSQNAYGAVPIGTLPAATSASPDVLTVYLPQIYITDPRYSPIPVLPDLAGWSIEGLYSPGGVSVSGSGLNAPDGGWPYVDVPESSVATALATGDVNALLNQYADGLDFTGADEWGLTEPMTDYSTATPNGNVTADINPTPVPEPTTATLMFVGAVSLLRRRRLT